jgi:hypothetical protein
VKIICQGQQNEVLGQFLFGVTRAHGPLSFIILNITNIDMAGEPCAPRTSLGLGRASVAPKTVGFGPAVNAPSPKVGEF